MPTQCISVDKGVGTEHRLILGRGVPEIMSRHSHPMDFSEINIFLNERKKIL